MITRHFPQYVSGSFEERDGVKVYVERFESVSSLEDVEAYNKELAERQAAGAVLKAESDVLVDAVKPDLAARKLAAEAAESPVDAIKQ